MYLLQGALRRKEDAFAEKMLNKVIERTNKAVQQVLDLLDGKDESTVSEIALKLSQSN